MARRLEAQPRGREYAGGPEVANRLHDRGGGEVRDALDVAVFEHPHQPRRHGVYGLIARALGPQVLPEVGDVLGDGSALLRRDGLGPGVDQALSALNGLVLPPLRESLGQPLIGGARGSLAAPAFMVEP